MKKTILNAIIGVILFFIPLVNFGQAPNLGTAANFVLFSSDGAVSNTGLSQLTGNVGTNNGSSTAFGNVNGGMHDGDGVSAQCATDLLTAYNQLDGTIPNFFPAPLLGNGAILLAGVYSIASAATLNLDLILNAQGNPNAVFIFKIEGAFSTNANAKVKLINGAMACNVFWKIEGLVSMATGTTMRGTIIANNAAIMMNSGDTLEGRALSTTGAISVDGVLAYTPIGCGSPSLTGPSAPALSSAECYSIFSSNGSVTNSGISFAVGDIGTNVGLTTGFSAPNVTGDIHDIPDPSTAECASDLLVAYNYLNGLSPDIELLYPAQFGSNLVLTPHTYIMNGAVSFTDTVYLNALGNANAIFIIKTYGAFSTSVGSKVSLINGAQAKNVYWMVNGAVSISDFSDFSGTLVCYGATDLLEGAVINGRVLTVNGALNTNAVNVTMPAGCSSGPPVITTQPVNRTRCAGGLVNFSVIAHGAGLTYQWRKGTVNLVNGGNISGATSAILTINPANTSDAASNYNVVVSGTTPPAETSVNASLTINLLPSITVQPTNQSGCAGSSQSFSVSAIGTGLTYRWRKGTVNLVNGGNISGATSVTLTINPVNTSNALSNYNVVVSGACSPPVQSTNASLTVNTAPSISSQPANQTACAGESASFLVTAIGTSPLYQWRKGTVNLVNGGNISGATSVMLTINPVNTSDAAANYNLVITGTCSPPSQSVNVSLTVTAAESITSQPANQTACVGESASFPVTAIGTGLTYQWRKGTLNLSNAGSISGATSSTLMINPVALTDSAANYNVVITGTCSPITSSDASLTICPATGIVPFDGNANQTITIYPNPSVEGKFMVRSRESGVHPSATLNINNVEVYNILGEKVFEKLEYRGPMTEGMEIDLSNLPSGIYFFKLVYDNKTIQSGKLISQH